jgi:GNAT superfamily N-acetyltransferase
MREENQLREGTEDDLDELVALWAHYIRDHRHNPAYNRVARTGFVSRRAAFASDIRDENAAVFVLARPDGGLDGMISCRVTTNLAYFQPHRLGRIQTPYVRPEARKKGNLKKLLTAAYRARAPGGPSLRGSRQRGGQRDRRRARLRRRRNRATQSDRLEQPAGTAG